jgi:hypothetical protein
VSVLCSSGQMYPGENLGYRWQLRRTSVVLFLHWTMYDAVQTFQKANAIAKAPSIVHRRPVVRGKSIR